MITALRTLFVACLCTTVIVSGCACNGAAGGTAVRGSGNTATEARDVSGFTDVRVAGTGEILVEQTGTDSLTIEAEDNILPELEATVTDGVLKLGTRPGVSIRPTRPIRYQVTVKQLTGVGIAGSGSIRATGVDTDKLTADISGSGSARLDGRADEVGLNVAGSGSYDASRLNAKTVRVTISGSGSATVNATEQLEANISGSGSVHYAGNPTVQKHVSGSGTVARR
jgi:hypothetical protein